MVYFPYPPIEDGRIEFEFDEQKSRANLKKHGIDFVQAQRLWLDQDRAEYPTDASSEARFLVVGRLDDRMWAAVITYRGKRIRIISVRHARRREMAEYGR